MPKPTGKVFQYGFYFSLALTGSCMLASFCFLLIFMLSTNSAIENNIGTFKALRQAPPVTVPSSSDAPVLPQRDVPVFGIHFPKREMATPARNPKPVSELALENPDEWIRKSILDAQQKDIEDRDKICALLNERFEAIGVQVKYINNEIERISDNPADLKRLEFARAENADVINFLSIGMSARVSMTKIALRACGVFGGMAICFLGFALFLIGIENDMDAEATGAPYSIRVVRLSPGAMALLSGAILIGITSTTSSTGFSLDRSSPQTDQVTPGTSSSGATLRPLPVQTSSPRPD